MDVLGTGMATYLVWSLQMDVKKKLMVFAIFNCRLLYVRGDHFQLIVIADSVCSLVVPIAFRLYYLHPSISHRESITADIVTEVVQGCAIIFACMACLKPFLSPFDPVAFNAGSAPRSGLFRYTAETQPSRGDRYFELSGKLRSSEKKSRTMESSRSIGDGSRSAQEDELPLTDKITSLPTFRPAGVMHSAQARSTHWQEHSGDHNDKPELRDDHSISKTQTWTISVRDR